MISESLNLGKRASEKIVELVESKTRPVFEAIYSLPENRGFFAKKLKKMFLGAHPKSLESNNIKSITQNPSDWLVCEKTDGTRFIMLILSNGQVILSGRDNDYYYANLPMVKNMVDIENKNYDLQYMFDGELVIDKKKGESTVRYLMFDCMIFRDENVYEKPYRDRLKYCLQFTTIRRDSIEMFTKLDKTDRIIKKKEAVDNPPIAIHLKDFFTVD
jgi:hypothetical protein